MSINGGGGECLPEEVRCRRREYPETKSSVCLGPGGGVAWVPGQGMRARRRG